LAAGGAEWCGALSAIGALSAKAQVAGLVCELLKAHVRLK
jgi:hypothetical protein